MTEHNENAEDTLSRSVHDAVAAFTRQVHESSEQLASAAARFAGESMRVIDGATHRAEVSGARSAEAALAAESAAREAREITAALQGTLAQAAEQVKVEARAFFQASAGETELAVQANRELMAEFQAKVADATQQIEASVAAAGELVAQAASAAREAQQTASALSTGRVPSGVGANTAPGDEIASLRQAVDDAERAAEEARTVALEANALAQRPPAAARHEISAGVQEVLERLEADYSLLTRLVEDLRARIQTPSAPGEYSRPLAPEMDTRPTAGVSVSPPRVEPPIGREEPASATPKPAEAAHSRIGGRVLVSISPVPDFDRLLSLDGALRIAGIGNVTLADYAHEEVTFRLEVDPPASVEDILSRLSLSTGADIEVVASSDDALALRLAS